MHASRTPAHLASLGFMLFLAMVLIACEGNYSGSGGNNGGSTGGGNSNGPDATAFANSQEFFTARIAPALDFCRTCHVPGGVGDTDKGERFMLSANSLEDYVSLQTSWETLGRGVETNRILLKPSGRDPEPHSGGTPWLMNSQSYADMKLLLSCWDNPAGCMTLLAGVDPGGGTVIPQWPLLGSSRGGHRWFDFCEDQPDSASLPADPRSLVQPGVNQNKAVYYNAFWKDCHIDPERVGEPAAPKTCGELRQFYAQGEALIKGNGAIGAGSYFSADNSQTDSMITAADYNNLWKKWNLPSRPDNFDALLAQRYGLGIGAERNPYPLSGENPNTTNGGSGQLPTAFTQLRTADGKWSGNLGLTCAICHSGQVGSAQDGPSLGGLHGNSNSISDVPLLLKDVAKQPGVESLLMLGRTRGTNNALALQIILLLTWDVRLDPSTVGFYVTSPNGGSIDAPAWWNVGHRPVRFQDGFMSSDALRSDLGFYLVPFDTTPAATNWVKAHVRAADTWILSLKAPPYPRAIDTGLAEQGAVLFHSKNLWADNLGNSTLKPQGGNGSCASCHGAYSPRYVNDPAYLDTPALEGVASYIVPRDLIGTDPARVDSDSEAAEQYGVKNFFAYPETNGTAQDCGPQNRSQLRGDRKMGYLAPPLYGIWASAPYFHNGSVPNLWEVLNPPDRKPIWRRVSTPARTDQAGKVVMGYDTDLERAYDMDRLGWRYDELSCGMAGTLPYLDCNPQNASSPLLLQLQSQVFGNLGLLWYVIAPPILTQQQIEDRKIYNTHMYSHSNAGHAFTAILTDQERTAIIEYLKTL